VVSVPGANNSFVILEKIKKMELAIVNIKGRRPRKEEVEVF